MTGSARNSLREALQERGWSYTRLAAELRRHAAGSQLPKTESLVTLISRWVNNHQQPDDFYRDLLAKALGRSRADLFGDEGAHLEPWAMVGPAELPHDVAGFIGRSGEIDELCRRLLGTGQGADGAVVTIDGPPGVGKSALAVHLAHQLCEHFPNAQLFADLRGDEGEGLNPTVVLHQFLRALGAPSDEIPSTLETAARAFRSRLAGRRVLVVLDNAVSERQVRPLLPGSPTCAVLITSRCPLPGLAEATALTLDLFPTSDAVRMLEQVAGPERVGVSEAATRMASQCGHLPLALRIAGARLRTRRAWTVETLAAFMEDERQRLGRLAMGELGVRASFSLSYRQLEPEAARTFRLLSLLGMPEISVGVAAAVTDRELAGAEAALEQLADAALVEALTPGRYRFHDLLRLFARERAEAEESANTRRAAVAAGVDWYLAHVLEAAVLLGPARSVDRTPVFAGLADALAWLDLERENLVRAVVAAGEHDLVAPCWQMADALFRFYELRRYLTDWQQVNEVALQVAERAGLHEVEGRMHNGIGYVYAQQVRFDEALEHLEAALAIRREVGDAAGEGRTLKNLGDVRIQLGQPHQALGSYEQALTISCAVGDRHRQGQALHGVGVALAALGRLPEAEQRLEEALSIRLEVGDEPGEARTRLWLGNVWRDRGWYARAREEYEGSLTILRRVGDRYHEGMALWQIGVAAQQQGDFETAQATWRHALSILGTLGCTEAEEVRGLLACEPAGSPALRHRLNDAGNFTAARTADGRRVNKLGERLGLPQIGTARPFALAMIIDAVGSGLFLPFSLLYFHYAGGLSLTEAGLGLTVSMLIAVPTPLAAGVLVDHVGPKTVAVATNAARVAGFLGYLLVHDLTTLIAAALLISVSDRLFWVAQPALIGEFATSGSRDRWFGLTVALRAAGLGIGGLLAGLAVSSLGIGVYHALVVANAVSFALAAALIASLRVPVPGRAAVTGLLAEPSPKGFRAVLADRPFCWIVASNVVFGIARTMILVGFPVYAIQVLGVPAWLAGVLYAVYTALLAVAQTSLVRRLEHHRRTRALMLSALLWAGSFVLLAVAPLLPRQAIVAYLSAVTVLYTVAVMVHAGVIDALVIEAAPDTLRGRYVAAFNLSWAAANALAAGLFTTLLAWYAGLPWIALTALLLLALVGVRRAEPRLARQAVHVRSDQPSGMLP